MCRSYILTFSFILSLFASSAEDLFTIVLPACPKPWERTAAAEISSCLDRRFTRRFTVGGVGGVRIHVGDTPLAAAQGVSSAALPDERWIVKSSGRDVIVNGGGSHGALYAASHFLEDFCGVRFWNDDETDIPQSESLDLPALDATGRPKFRYRDIYRGKNPTNATPRLAVMRRLNRNGDATVPQEWGGEFTYGPPYHCHTFDRMVPWSVYGKDHPEWFSLWEGKRIGGLTTGQLCLTNPELRAKLLSVLRENIAKGDAAAKAVGVPAPRVYELSINDDEKYCQCEKCMAEVEKYGFSGFYLNVVNEIADEIARTRPEIFISMLTYLYCEPPPKGGVRPRDNVIVKLCDTRTNQAAGLGDPSNANFRRFLGEWSKVARHLIIWDYAVVFVNPSAFFPFASEFTLGETYRMFHENNVFGIFLEQGHFDVADMNDLKFYLESRLFEDPHLDVDALISDFMDRYFGPAGKPILKARRHLQRIGRERGANITWFPQPTAFDYIRLDDLEKMARLWNEAEAAVANDPKRLLRVRHARNGQDALLRFRRQAPRVENGRLVYGGESFDPAPGTPYAVVKDPASPSGTALKIDLDKAVCTQFSPPFMCGIFDAPKGKPFSENRIRYPADPAYGWVEFEDVKIPKHNNHYFYLGGIWGPQIRVYHPGYMGRRCRLRILLRGEGPKFRVKDSRPNALYVARIEFVPGPTAAEARPYAVVLPAAPKPWERSAANELETFLSQAAKDRRVLVDGRDAVRFNVGDTPLAVSNGLDSATLPEEQWVIRSFGRDVVVNGGGSHGALYAVSHFLEDFCDVRFWNDAETDVPPAKPLDFPALDASGRPKFRYRDIYRGSTTNATPVFAIRRRLNRNGESRIPQALGGEFTYGPPYHCHTFDRMVPWGVYGKKHPEWFSLWEGKRIGGLTTGQLCLTNPELRAKLLEVLRSNIAKGDAAAAKAGVPAPRVYELSMNDDDKYCQCTNCMAEVEKYGFSGFYLNVVNDIAQEIAKTRPELFISMLTYIYTEPPPKGGVRPRDNVIVKLCDTRSNQAAPVTDPCNREFLDFLKSWGKIAKNLLVWDYSGVYVNPSVSFPFASEFAYGETYREFHRNNVFGVFIEHPPRDMNDLKYYMESKLFEDPYLDADALVADFMKRYFGPAGRHVLAARRHLDGIRRQRGGFITFMAPTEKFDFIAMPDIEKMAALWDAAEAAVKDDEKLLKRVRKARGSQDAIRRFRMNDPRVENGEFIFDPKAFGDAKAPILRVKDAESPCGEAVKIPMDKFGGKPFGPPLRFGVYDRPSAKHLAQGNFPPAKGEGYEWFTFENVQTPKTGNNVFYFSSAWRPNMCLCHPGLNDGKFTMRVLAKFTGPRNHPGSKSENAIYIAQVRFVPAAKPEKENAK